MNKRIANAGPNKKSGSQKDVIPADNVFSTGKNISSDADDIEIIEAKEPQKETEGLEELDFDNLPEQVMYISTNFLGLKIVIQNADYEYHPVTKKRMLIDGKYFKFIGGRLILTKPEDIICMETILAGDPENKYGRLGMKRPPGVRRISGRAIKMVEETSNKTRDAKDAADLIEINNKARGVQGVRGLS